MRRTTKKTTPEKILYHLCEQRCYVYSDALVHPHHEPGTCALGWGAATEVQRRAFIEAEPELGNPQGIDIVQNGRVTQHIEPPDALTEDVAYCAGCDKLKPVSELAFCGECKEDVLLCSGCRSAHAHPEDPREALIDELTAALKAFTDLDLSKLASRSIDARRTAHRNGLSALARATAHREARR
jgi:hypothetical protein